MTAMFYDSMRALGPLTLDEVPEAVAAQIVATGTFAGDRTQARAAISLYSQLARQLNREDFQTALIKGELPGGVALDHEAMSMAGATKSCCGHTCEGTCTPSGK
jgi:hypothetical protein